MKSSLSLRSYKSVSRYFPVVLVIGLSIVLIEMVEHYYSGEELFSPHFLIEMLVFGVGTPILGVVLFMLIERAEIERDQVADTLEKHLAFSEEIKTTPQYKELINHVALFPKNVAPVQTSYLHIFDSERGIFRLEVVNGEEPARIPVEMPAEITRDVCRACLLANPVDCAPRPCALAFDDPAGRPAKRYMMPLVYGKAIVAISHFDLVDDNPLTLAQIHTLKGLAPNMALAIESARLRDSHTRLVETALAERRTIAKELHDTLAQSLTYLRMKLDQFSADDSLAGITSIQKDLHQMRDIAEIAYAQVRNTLASLQPRVPQNLVEEIRSHSRKVGKRIGVAVNFKNHGDPAPLPPFVQKQLTYICREALYNIEKHAKAGQVEINLSWRKTALTIKITDDGRGFDPATTKNESSMGITLMHELAAEVNATVLIRSVQGLGTEVTVYMPLPRGEPFGLPAQAAVAGAGGGTIPGSGNAAPGPGDAALSPGG